MENLIFGIALLIMAFQKDRATVKFTAWLIMVVLIARWIIISVFTLLGNSNLKQLIPDTIAIFVVIILLFFGTKVRVRKTVNQVDSW
jgi:hypothetical protein